MHWRSSIFRRASGRDCAVVAPVSPPAAKRPRPWGHGRYKAQGLMKRSQTSLSFFPEPITSFLLAASCAWSWQDRAVASPTSIRPFFWRVLSSSIFFVRHVWPLARLPQPFVVSLNALAYFCIVSRQKAGCTCSRRALNASERYR